MTTLKFVFNKEKVAAAGTTEDAMCVITMFVPEIVEKNPEYINFLEKWPLNVDGEDEDCIDSSCRWLRKHNMLKETN